MSIPNELMPQSKPKKQKSDHLQSGNFKLTEKQENIKTCEQGSKVTKEQNHDNNIAIKPFNNLTISPNKRINFSWVAKHLLPIFLFVILAATVSIAAVPSWRASFNKFIAKWSPKAETACNFGEEPEHHPTGLAPFEITPQEADVETYRTATIKNSKETVCEKSKFNFPGGFSMAKIGGLPSFNVDGYAIIDGQVMDGKEGRSEIKIIKSISPNNDTVSLCRWDKDIGHEVCIKKNLILPIPANYSKDWTTVQWDAEMFDINCGDDANIGQPDGALVGDMSVTFLPIGKAIGWNELGYNVVDGYFGNIADGGSCYGIYNGCMKRYYLVKSKLQVKAKPVKDPISLELKDDKLEGRGQLKIKTTQLTSLIKDGLPISASITLRSPSDKVQFVYDKDGIEYSNVIFEGKTNPDEGELTVAVKGTDGGTFTLDVQAKSDDQCYSTSTTASITFLKYKLKVSIGELNPDYTPSSKEDDASWQSQQKWKLVEGTAIDLYQVPTIVTDDGKPRASVGVSLKDGNDKPLSGETIKPGAIAYGSEQAPSSGEQKTPNIQFTDENNQDVKELKTDALGIASYYVKSEDAGKFQMSAEFIKDGQPLAYAESMREDEVTGKEKKVGIEFGALTGEIKIASFCNTPDTKSWDQIAADIGMVKAEPAQKSWLAKLINKTKNIITSILGLNKKAYSEGTGDQICNSDLDSIEETADSATKSADTGESTAPKPIYIVQGEDTNAEAELDIWKSMSGATWTQAGSTLKYIYMGKIVYLIFKTSNARFETEVSLERSGYKRGVDLFELNAGDNFYLAFYLVKDETTKVDKSPDKNVKIKESIKQTSQEYNETLQACINNISKELPQNESEKVKNECLAKYDLEVKKYLQEHYDDIVSPGEAENYNNLKNISNDNGKLKLKEFADKELKSMNFKENQSAIMVFLFTVDKENTVSSNSQIKSAHAEGTGESNVNILSDDHQKYLKNEFVNTPIVKIVSIERDLNGNDKIEDNEKFTSPIDNDGNLNEDVKTNCDSNCLKEKGYTDVYYDDISKNWKEKVFPGDKIKYLLTFKNESGSDLIKPDLIWSIPKSASDWLCKNSTKENTCGKEYSSKVQNNQTIIYKSIAKISAGETIEPISFWIKLDNDLLLDIKTVNNWAAIGMTKYKYIFPGGIPLPEYVKSKGVWVNRDIFGKVEGQIKAADGYPLSRVLVGLVANDKPLTSFESSYKNDKQILKNYLTDKDGNYSLEFNRRIDFPNSNYKKIQLSANYYDPVSGLNRMIKTSELKNSDILYFLSKKEDISLKAEQKINIDLSQGEKAIDYPNHQKNLHAFQQAIGGSVIWNNINSAFKTAKEDYGIDVDTFTDKFSINFIPPSSSPEKDLSYAKENNIYLAHNVWNSAYFTPQDRSAHNEFHEFSHYLLNKIGIDPSKQGSGDGVDDEVQLLVPMIDESAHKQCGIASTEMVYNWVINNGKPKQNTEYTVDTISCTTGEDQYTWLINNTNLPWTWNRIDSTDPVNNKPYFDKIRKSINYGYPVIVYTNFYGMHIFVITGYDNKGNFYLNDPAPSRKDSFLLRQNQQYEDTYDQVINGKVVLSGGTKVTEQSLSEHFKYPSSLPPSTGSSGDDAYGVGGMTFMSEDYASNNPLRGQTAMNAEYYSYLNSKTNYSFIEGLASFLALDLDHKINKTTEWIYKLPRREAEYDLNVPQPSFAGYGEKYPNGITNQTNESWVMASLIKQLTYGGSNQNDKTFWLQNVKDIDISVKPLLDVNKLISILISKQPNNAYGLLLTLLEDEKGIGNSNSKIYIANNGKELVVNDLKKDFLLYGFFKDNNVDSMGNWIYNTTGLEDIGKAANGVGFDAKYHKIKFISKAENVPDTSIKSSPYIEIIMGGKSTEKNPYDVTIDRVILGELETKYYDSRLNRQEIPPVPGSYLKLNYPGKKSDKVTVKVEFDSPNEALNYTYDYLNKSGEYTYFTLPYSTYHTKATISAEGYPDTITIDSGNYWKTISSDLMYDYIMEHTFGMPDISVPEKVPPTAPVQAPALTTTNADTGSPANNVAGGETVVVNTDNFDNSEKVSVYFGNKKVGEVNTLGKDFGLEVKIPDNVPLGQNTIKLVDDKGKEVSGSINVTSNKYFNRVTILIFFIFIIFIVLAIYIYKKTTKSHNILHSPPTNLHPSAS